MNSVNANRRIDLSQMGLFGQIQQSRTSDGNSIVHVSDKNGGSAAIGGTHRSGDLHARWHRSDNDKAANNETRTILLESLSSALGERVERDDSGSAVFSKTFLEHLDKILGGTLSVRDFALDANGHVASGRPLTERRISQIVDKVHDLAAQNPAPEGANGAPVERTSAWSAVMRLNLEKERAAGVDTTQPPAISSKNDLLSFLKTRSLAENGKVEEGPRATDLDGKEARTFLWKGLVFRVDTRSPEIIKNAGGFTSRLDLSNPDNLREAQGLGKRDGNNKIFSAYGVTGRSGVSCSRTPDKCISYSYATLEDGKRPKTCYLYVIDTRDMGEEKAWDMKATTEKNGHDDGSGAGSEVNVSKIPVKNIVGACFIPIKCLNPDSSVDQVEALVQHLENHLGDVMFNDEYAP